jgi:hypothetical protein
MSHAFTAELWIWEARKSDSWTFITVPQDFSDELRAQPIPGSGFGSIRVRTATPQAQRWPIRWLSTCSVNTFHPISRSVTVDATTPTGERALAWLWR